VKEMITNILKEIFHYSLKLIILVIAVVVVYRSAIWAYDSTYNIMAREPEENIQVVNVEVEIPQGSSTEVIAKILYDNGLISNELLFRLEAMWEGADAGFQYGTYTFNTGMSDGDIMTILSTEGTKRETVTFTIPEGFTLDQIASRLSAEGLCTVSEFMAAVEQSNYGYDFLDEIPDRVNRMQGYLFPATYEVYADATAESIVSTMLQKFDNVFKDEYYDRMNELGYTLDEVITIASIIEKEVRVAEERPLVSSVIYNRLDIDMNLQMCSTIMYTLEKPRNRLLYSDLEIDSPYNTYKYSGLPVGPIANPGEASIIAALYPDDTPYLFFVLIDEETGQHEFNTTLNEHNAAKNKYNQDF
jgi:UPF0755 protein